MLEYKPTCAVQGCDGGPQVELCDISKRQEVDKEDRRDPDSEVHDFIKELESKYITSSVDGRCDMSEFCIAYYSLFVIFGVLCRQSHDDLDDLVMSDPLEWFGVIYHPSLKQSAEIFGAGEMP